MKEVAVWIPPLFQRGILQFISQKTVKLARRETLPEGDFVGNF